MPTANSNFGFLLQLINSGGPLIGAGDPEGAVTGDLGDIWLRTDGGPGNSLYLKQANGGGDTGWVPAGPPLTADLSAQADGVATVFTLADKAFHSIALDIIAEVQVNGLRQREGVSEDFVFSESVVGQGFDTLTFNFTPQAGDVVFLRYLPR